MAKRKFYLDLSELYLALGGNLPTIEDVERVEVCKDIYLNVDGSEDPEYPFIELVHGSKRIADGDEINVVRVNPDTAAITVKHEDSDDEFELPRHIAVEAGILL